jgi:lipoprotein signal peptidase
MKKYKKILYIFCFLFLVVFDQLSKYIIRRPPAGGGGFYICNANLAFSIKLSYFLVFTFILVLLLFLFKIRNHKSQITNHKQIKNLKFQNIKRWFGNLNLENCNLFGICNLEFGALILIFSGGISNIIDRIYFGCVIDFIDLKFWPVFNFADIFITFGVVILIFKLCPVKFSQPQP